jgi:hypothetical protein
MGYALNFRLEGQLPQSYPRAGDLKRSERRGLAYLPNVNACSF